MFLSGKELRIARKSTVWLEEILHRDFHSPGKLSPENLLRAAQVLAKRDGDGDPGLAWEQFQEKYRPFLTDGRSLYEDLEEPEGPQASAQTPPPTRKRWRKILLWALCAAAVLITASLAAAALESHITGDVTQDESIHMIDSLCD